MIQTLRANRLDGNRSQKLDSSAVHLWAVLLAGGDGVRLRDLTRRIEGDSRPKQFCRIIRELEAAYRPMPAVDLSRPVLALQPHRLLAVRDTTSGWADLGSPSRVIDTLARNNIQPALSRELPNSSHLTADFSRCQVPDDVGAAGKFSHSALDNKEHYS
jgi:hypothetical protein